MLKLSTKSIKIIFLLGILTACSSKISPTATNAPQSTISVAPTQILTPQIGIGSIQVSPQDGMKMVFVPAGEFKMGSDTEPGEEKPLHTVNLDAFWIDQTEVTNTQFELFVKDSGYKTDAEKGGGSVVFNIITKKMEPVKSANWKHPQGVESSLNGLENHPVVQISWNDATAYCKWAGRRLPTEAEWEKAARGLYKNIYPWGNMPPAGNLLNFADKNLPANQSDNSIDDGYQFTSPVGNYPSGASPYDALDMAGNVWEWVSDWYALDYYKESPVYNPQGPLSGSNRVLRGGSWGDIGINNRSDNRLNAIPNSRGPSVGYRCAMSANP
jgi:formylglycine-generating enzyme required for sulfatase activity